MAMFHFRIKSDKKSDGSKVSAVQHVDYIRRQGIYSDDKECKKVVENFISAKNFQSYTDQFDLLYKTDEFGCISNSSKGITVTNKPSPTTFAIALKIANVLLCFPSSCVGLLLLQNCRVALHPGHPGPSTLPGPSPRAQ